jgi:hypothetical protein
MHVILCVYNICVYYVHAGKTNGPSDCDGNAAADIFTFIIIIFFYFILIVRHAIISNTR